MMARATPEKPPADAARESVLAPGHSQPSGAYDMRRSARRWIVVMTIAAVPVTLLLESALRILLESDDLVAIRLLLEPTMTPVAWVLAAVTALGSVASVLVGWRLARRGRFAVGAFLLVASLAQAPALLAALAPFAGSSAVPPVLAAGISTAAVILLALRTTAD